MASSSSSFRTPVISINNPYGMLKAAQDTGCFRLTDFQHLLSPTLMAAMKGLVRGLFDRPLSVKQNNESVYVSSGYTAPNRDNPLYEALGILDARRAADILTFCNQLEVVLPKDRDTILDYTRAIQMSITNSLSTGLGVRLSTLEMLAWPYHIKLNKYHFNSDTVGTVGVQLHTDSSFLTVLQDDESVSGLEIEDQNNNYVCVEPCPGTLLVNLGDMATVWSNGRLKNVRHRVLCKDSAVRVSMASFLLGPTGVVEPRPELVDSKHPRRYISTSFDENRTRRFDTGQQAGQTIDELRIY